MARPRGKNKASCQNENCQFYLKETGKDIIKKGINRAGHRQYYCLHCRHYFAETKGTPLYQRKLKEHKIKQICKELVEKKGIRAVERTLHVNRNTICSILNSLAEHALSMTNHLVHDLGLSAYEVDELITFIKKTKKNLNPSMIASLNQARQQLRHA